MERWRKEGHAEGKEGFETQEIQKHRPSAISYSYELVLLDCTPVVIYVFQSQNLTTLTIVYYGIVNSLQILPMYGGVNNWTQGVPNASHVVYGPREQSECHALTTAWAI